MSSISFAEAWYDRELSVASPVLRSLSYRQAVWLDEMPEEVTFDDVKDIPYSIFEQMYTDVIRMGPNGAEVTQFLNFVASLDLELDGQEIQNYFKEMRTFLSTQEQSSYTALDDRNLSTAIAFTFKKHAFVNPVVHKLPEPILMWSCYAIAFQKITDPWEPLQATLEGVLKLTNEFIAAVKQA